MTRETWKAIPGYEGAYEVSDQGRVRSLDRHITAPNRWGGVMRRRCRGKILTPVRNLKRGGYQYVTLMCDGNEVKRRVAGLVAAVFLGPRPTNLVVCHKNGNAQDDRADNLRYGTQQSNIDDQLTHGTRLFGEKNAAAVLTAADVAAIKASRGVKTQQALADEYGIQQSQVSRIQRKQRWAHVA